MKPRVDKDGCILNPNGTRITAFFKRKSLGDEWEVGAYLGEPTTRENNGEICDTYRHLVPDESSYQRDIIIEALLEHLGVRFLDSIRFIGQSNGYELGIVEVGGNFKQFAFKFGESFDEDTIAFEDVAK